MISLCVSSFARATVPKIFHVSASVQPGETVLLYGDGLAEVSAKGWRIADAEVQDPSEKQSALPSTEGKSLRILQSSNECAKVLLPMDWQPGLYAIRLQNSSSPSDVVWINRTEPQWWLGAPSDVAYIGQTLRVFGKNFGEHTNAWLTNNGISRRLEPIKREFFHASFKIPSDLTPGTYELWLHNGYGGPTGFAKAPSVHVIAAVSWPETIYDVKTFGANGDGHTDDTQAIQKALLQAEQHNGGVVHLSAATYVINQPLMIPSFTTLKGEGQDKTKIITSSPLKTMIKGNAHFAVTDLRLISSTAEQIIICPDEPKLYNRYGVNAPAFSCNDMQLVRLTIQHEVPVPQPMPSNYRKTRTVTAFGPDIILKDCHIINTSGMPLALFALHHDQIIHNHFEPGEGGWVGMWDEDESVFENNELHPLPNTHGNGTGIQGDAYRFYFAGNHIHDLRGTYGEAFSFDTAYFAFWIGHFESLGDHLLTVPSATLTDQDPHNKSTFGQALDLKGKVVVIVQGKGLGQRNRIVSNTAQTLTLEEDWIIPPDANSVLAVLNNKTEIAMVNNHFENVAAMIQLYSQGYGIIIDHNEGTNTGGTYGTSWDFQPREKDKSIKQRFGRPMHRLSICYFNEWTHNHLTGVLDPQNINAPHIPYPNAAIIGPVLSVQGRNDPLDVRGITTLGNIERDNLGDKDVTLSLVYQNKNKPHPTQLPPMPMSYIARDTIIEGNKISNSSVCLDIYPGNQDTLVHNNHFQNCSIPIQDSGIHTLIEED